MSGNIGNTKYFLRNFSKSLSKLLKIVGSNGIGQVLTNWNESRVKTKEHLVGLSVFAVEWQWLGQANLNKRSIDQSISRTG